MGLTAALLGGGAMNAATNTASAVLNYQAQKETNATNVAINAMNNAANANLASKQNEWNLAQWNRENEYNAPGAQAQRLQQAGLSQAAAAQAVANVPAGNLQSAELANQAAPPPLAAPQLDLSALANIGNNFVTFARGLQELRKEKAVASQEEQKANLTTSSILTDMDAKRWATNEVIQRINQSAKEFPYKLKSIEYKSLSDAYLEKTAKVGYLAARQNYRLAKQQFGFLDKFNPERLRQIGAEIQDILADAAKKRQDIAESKTRQDNMNADTANKLEEFKGISLDNIAKRCTAAFAKHGFPETTAEKTGALVAEGVLPSSQIVPFFLASRSYIRSGGKVFNGSIQERQYFNHFINPGVANSDKQGILSHGTFMGLERIIERGLGVQPHLEFK